MHDGHLLPIWTEHYQDLSVTDGATYHEGISSFSAYSHLINIFKIGSSQPSGCKNRIKSLSKGSFINVVSFLQAVLLVVFLRTYTFGVLSASFVMPDFPTGVFQHHTEYEIHIYLMIFSEVSENYWRSSTSMTFRDVFRINKRFQWVGTKGMCWNETVSCAAPYIGYRLIHIGSTGQEPRRVFLVKRFIAF